MSKPTPFFLSSRGWLGLIPLLLLPIQVYGQIPDDTAAGGTGGRHTVQGTVFYPGGRRVDRTLKVRISSIGFGEQFTTTDSNGSFIFQSLRGGTYTLTVDAGSEFELARETVDIIEPSRRGGLVTSGSTRSVQITLRPRLARAGAAPGTVSAASGAIPALALERYNNGLKAAKEGDTKKAIGELKEALTIYPQFMAAFNELGLQYLARKDLPMAIEAFRSARKIEPGAAAPQLNLGIALVDNKQYKEAAAELQDVVKKQATSAPAHLYLGQALIRLGSYDDAETELKRALELGGGPVAEAHRYLGVVYIEKGRRSEAVDELEAYLKLMPKAKDAGSIKRIIQQMRESSQK
jgi:tetratricopeptide (TPR) repeat protein